MQDPCFEVETINLGSYAIHDGGKTVALVTPHGWVDWILASPDAPGRRLRRIYKETHMALVLGLKFNLHFCHLTEPMDAIDFEVLDGGHRLRIVARSHSKDGAWRAEHRALLELEEPGGRYRWTLDAELQNVSDEPIVKRFIEYTNVYPAGCGRCMLFTPEKRFQRTLLLDAEANVWEFPHQHLMHYKYKLEPLRFACGTIGGFFGESLNPVVTVQACSLPPDWEICDMYFDLHCGLLPPEAIPPGGMVSVQCCIEYWDGKKSEPFEGRARHLPITAADFRRWSVPRLELGRNDFNHCVRIDEVDDASGFRQDPPSKVWDRETGAKEKGSLRLTNETATETVWPAEPPTQVPSNCQLRLTGLARVKDVTGKGFFLRLRYHTFEWRPTPHMVWARTLESSPLKGDSGDRWTRIETPLLTVPPEDVDYFLGIEVVLDGEGVAWLTDMDVDLQYVEDVLPAVPVKPPAG